MKTTKLKSVKPTAKETIATLEDTLAKAVDDAAHWKQEAVDAEKQIQEAVRLLGLSAYSELVEGVKELRATLEMGDDDLSPVDRRIRAYMSAAEDASRSEADKEEAEARVCTLDEALAAALEDRAALLRKLKLTESEWYMQNGAHPAHLET